jgi:hypothetical protein
LQQFITTVPHNRTVPTTVFVTMALQGPQRLSAALSKVFKLNRLARRQLLDGPHKKLQQTPLFMVRDKPADDTKRLG